jgi:riboflavin transporter FmnP
MQHHRRLHQTVFLSLLAGCAFVMEYLNFPLPPFPSFLKIDFSEIPALIGALFFGPVSGIVIEFLKNLLHFFFSGSETGAIPVGQMANFVAGSLFVTLAAGIGRKTGRLKELVWGLVLATVLMSLTMTAANWYVLIPVYSKLTHWTVTHSQKVELVLYGVAPFNMVKGFLIASIFIPLYMKMRPLLERQFSFR